jgi:GDP-D-mannose dehydratase
MCSRFRREHKTGFYVASMPEMFGLVQPITAAGDNAIGVPRSPDGVARVRVDHGERPRGLGMHASTGILFYPENPIRRRDLRKTAHDRAPSRRSRLEP